MSVIPAANKITATEDEIPQTPKPLAEIDAKFPPAFFAAARIAPTPEVAGAVVQPINDTKPQIPDQKDKVSSRPAAHPATMDQVFAAIESERAFQRDIWAGETPHIADLILLAQEKMNAVSRSRLVSPNNIATLLDYARQAAAILVVMMEDRGAPLRDGYEYAASERIAAAEKVILAADLLTGHVALAKK